MSKLVNTHLLSPAANTFRDKGFYCEAPEGTKDWYDYWSVQKDRCLNGFSIGDISITGYHYFYLNFSRIKVAKQTKGSSAKKQFDFPDFWDRDYDWFWLVEIARNGVSKEFYNNLDLYVDVHPDYITQGGFHLSCLKSRRQGYSYKAGNMAARNFLLIPSSGTYAFAYDDDYLYGDALLDKSWGTIYFNNKHCPWGQPLLVDRQLYKKAGYEEQRDGKTVESGFLSFIKGVGLYNNPDKVRGKDAGLLFFEEAGKNKDLLKAWEIARSTVTAGAYTTGLMIAFGTGGSGGEDMIGLEELYRKPEAYGILPVYNIWEDGMEQSVTGFFVSVCDNMEGHMDEDGNSDLEEAKQDELDERKKMKDKRQESYVQYVAEHPFTPGEALMNTSINIFPTKQLVDQKTYVIANPEVNNLAVSGYLTRELNSSKGTNEIKFKIDPESQPLNHFPHKSNEDLTGAIRIWETPYRDEGTIPDNLYFIALDPYAFESSGDMTSVGAAYVFKRTNNFSPSFSNLPVASYVGRPQRLDVFNKNLFMLAEYYNAKIGFENDRGNTIDYARSKKKLDMLAKEFTFDYKKSLASSTVNRGYGMHVTSDRKEVGLMYLRDWLLDIVAKTKNNDDIYRYQQIYDVGLLEELHKYNDKGNFDRVSALIVAMFYMKELRTHEIKQAKEDELDFFKEVYHGMAR